MVSPSPVSFDGVKRCRATVEKVRTIMTACLTGGREIDQPRRYRPRISTIGTAANQNKMGTRFGPCFAVFV